MPIKYKDIPIGQLLRNQEAYECIERAGKLSVPGFDMHEFESKIMEGGSCQFNGRFSWYAEYPHIIFTREFSLAVIDEFSRLDERMPFLRFKEEGQHYAYELFLSDPLSLGSRGALPFWNYVARKLTYIKLPASDDTIRQAYLSVVDELGMSTEGDTTFYIEAFSFGGMSTGLVMSEFLKEGLETIMRRSRKYRDLDTGKGRITI